jgi:hypothetical protein
MSREWDPDEVKGRALTEEQVGKVVALCRRYDVLLEVRAFDISRQPDSLISEFRLEQAARLTATLSPAHSSQLRRRVEAEREYMERMTNQLFVQALLTVFLFDDVLRNAIPYYSLRRPSELASFRWRVDAKDEFVTEAESLWRFVLSPLLQTMSLQRPYGKIPGGDYSYLHQFEGLVAPELEEFARSRGIPFERSAPQLDLAKVVETDFAFRSSKEDSGVRLVDVLSAAIRRAMMGRLDRHGWKRIGSLMATNVRLTAFVPDGYPEEEFVRDGRVINVMNQIEKYRKKVLPS